MHVAVRACRGNGLTIWGPGNVSSIGKVIVGEDVIPITIPYMDVTSSSKTERSVNDTSTPSRGNVFAIGRPSCLPYRMRVSSVCQDGVSCPGIPYLCRWIVDASTPDTVSIRRQLNLRGRVRSHRERIM